MGNNLNKFKPSAKEKLTLTHWKGREVTLKLNFTLWKGGNFYSWILICYKSSKKFKVILLTDYGVCGMCSLIEVLSVCACYMNATEYEKQVKQKKGNWRCNLRKCTL